MLPTAHVVHRLGGRLRLKVPERRRDATWFSQAASRIERLPGVLRVEARSLSGSLLIHYRPGPGLEQRFGEIGRFRIIDGPLATPPVMEKVSKTFQLSDQTLATRTGGRANMRSLLIVTLVILAIVQAVRGKILVPAISLLFFAYHLAATAEEDG